MALKLNGTAREQEVLAARTNGQSGKRWREECGAEKVSRKSLAAGAPMAAGDGWVA